MTTSAPTRMYGHLIGRDRVHGPTFQRLDPARGLLVAEYAAGSAVEVDAAVRSAAAAFASPNWRRMPSVTRAELLEALAGLLEGAGDRLASLDSQEVGKPLTLARQDVALGVGHVRHAAALARTERGESYPGAAASYTVFASREPVGVAALITPWNFPALILLQKLPYALAAGCAVVVKPSEFTSSSTLEIAGLCLEAGIPPGVVNVVTGTGDAVGAPLARHPLVSHVSFTGSTRVGREIMRLAAEPLTRTGLELGGNTANVVFADADLDVVADAVVFGAFANQGESCVAGSRLIADASVACDLTREIVSRVRELKVGMPEDPEAHLGALIHRTHRDRVHEAVTAAVREGATLSCGGGAPGAPEFASGAFYEPTVLTHVAPHASVFQEEVFGPVLTVTPFTGIEDALALANGTPYGLAHSVWTCDVDTALDVSARLDAGTVWVNTTSDGAPALPFGGVKDSGFGRDGGAEGLREFTTYKTVQFRSERRPSPFAPRAH